MTPYSISCPTCNARLKVRDQRAIGELSLCPKCGSMVMITPPSPNDSSGGKHPAGGRQPHPSDSSRQVVVGGGALGSDFDDAAALLADTQEDVVSKPSDISPQDPAAGRQETRKDVSDGRSRKEPPPDDGAAAQPSADSRVAKTSDARAPRQKDDAQSGDRQRDAAAAASAAAMPPADAATSAPVAVEPPPIEPPTDSMSSIELDPGAAAGGVSPLAQAGSTKESAGAATAAADADSDSGTTLSPPLAQPAWKTPAQLAWQRYGLIGAAALAAVVMVGGLLAFLLSGPRNEPVAEGPPTANNVAPIPDPDTDENRDAAADDKRAEENVTNEEGRAETPAETPAGTGAPNDGGAGDPEPADPSLDDLNLDEPTSQPEPLPASREEDDGGSPDSPPSDAPPLFAGDEPEAPPEELPDEPVADTGLGELAPLIDAFHVPPAPAETTPSPKEPADTPAPVRTPTASRPRPDPVNIDVEARLKDEVAGIDTGGAPLAKVVELITQLSTIPITLEPESLDQMKVAPDTPVSVVLSDTTVENILAAVLSEHGLSYEIRDDQIVVVSAASLGKLRTVKHAVDDLVESEDDVRRLAGHIKALIAPPSWEEAGGEGSIATSTTTFTIKNSFDVQFRAHVFLQKLRVARGLEPRSKFDPAMFALASRTKRIEEKLKTPVRAVYHVEQPLVDVLNHLEKAAGVTFLIDWEALGEVGWPPHSTAAVIADDVPLDEALDDLLGPMDLTYRAIDDSTLQITSLKALLSEPELELYPVRDVLVAQSMAPAKLTDNLKEELGAGLFVDGGGRFAIRYDEPSQCLLVRLPQAQQRAVEELLDKWTAE